VWCKLGDIVEHNTGKTLDKTRNTGIFKKYITTSNLYWNSFDFTELREMPFEEKELTKFTAVKGDLLICEGGDAGRSAIWLEDNSMCFQNHIHRVRPYGNISSLYLYYYMFYIYHNKDIKQYLKGVGIQSLSGNALASIAIPLPPLKEQQRIVQEVDRLFTLIDQLEEDKIALQQLITQLKSKILSLAIRGQLVPQDANDEPAEALLKQINPAYKSSGNLHYKNLPKGWAMCKLGEVCEAERGITFPSSAKKFQFEEGTIACLRTANVQELLDIEDLWYIDESYLKGNKRKYIQIGDVMMSTANSRELVGKVSFVRELDKPMSFGGFIMALRAKGIHSEYLYIVLRTLFLEGYFSKIASQTTNIANLNTRNLNEIDILLPPLAEQQRISEKITELFNIIDTIQNALNS